MDLRRIYHSFRLLTISSGIERAKYLRKNKIFGNIGENVMFQPRIVPLFKEKIGEIYIGDNVVIGACSLVNKDIQNNKVNGRYTCKKNFNI